MSKPKDWADELAARIASNLGVRTDEISAAQMGLVATRLRLVRAEGISEGVDQALTALKQGQKT